MTTTFCEVKDGNIVRYNLRRPRSWGNTSFSLNATDTEYIAVGLYPVVGEAPAYDHATQKLEGPTLTVNGYQVDRSYTVREFTTDEIAAQQAALVVRYEAALENLLDTKARERTWKDCMSARAAAGSPSSFQPEGIAFVNWWSACWELAHTILAEVQAGARPMPTVEEFLAEMPELVLPV